MSGNSIKRNVAYKFLLTVSTYIMGFITFPYISRVFGVEKLGLVNFVDNTVNYFLLFATMGISLLGVREIATVKNSREECSKVFSSILGLNFVFTAATLAVYFVLVACVPKLSQYSQLFYIGSAKILFTSFLIEWFFTGIENFRYITLRSLLIKTLYIASIFIFVKRQDQYPLYFILTVATVVVNAIINIVYARKYVDIVPKELFSFKYLGSNVTLGINSIVTSMYLTFNVMYLGFVASNTQVGYYTAAFKLYSVILAFFSAFTSVMLPRMSALHTGGEQETFQKLISKSLSVVIALSAPIIIYTEMMAPQIIDLLSGAGYEGAVLPMRIIMPAILFVGIAQVLVVQLLIPLKKDSLLLKVYILSALVGLAINIFAVHKIQSVGSAIVLLTAEGLAALLFILYVRRNRLADFSFRSVAKSIGLSLPLVPVCYFSGVLFDSSFIALATSGLVSAGIYLAYFKFLKDFKKGVL